MIESMKDSIYTLTDVIKLMFEDGTVYTYIGYAAGMATIAAFALQAIRILKTKTISGLSGYMYILYSLSLICWFTYGVYIESWILAIFNLITFVFTFVILLLILYYDEEDKIERYRRDPLTYVFNKKYYEECVPQKIASSVCNKSFSIIVGRINNLTIIQNQLGRRYYNRTLKQTAKTLEKALRDSDFIARIDENLFAIYLANATAEIAQKVLERVNESISSVSFKKGDAPAINVSMSFGICSSDESLDLNELTQKATKALSSVTPKTKSGIKIYSQEKTVKVAHVSKPKTPKAAAKITKETKAVKKTKTIKK